MALLAFSKFMAALKKSNLAMLSIYLYFYFMTTATCLVNMDAIPEALTGHKFYFEWFIFIPYVVCMILPF